MKETATKAYFATGGGGLGAAISAVLVNSFPALQPEWAVSVICTAIVSGVVTFLAPANQPKG